MEKNLLAIDYTNIAYRNYFGRPKSYKNKDGLLTNAIFGFIQTIQFAIKKYNITHIFVAKDANTCFRNDIYRDYKKNKQNVPDDLKKQLELIDIFLKISGIHSIIEDENEANDIISSFIYKNKDYFDSFYVLSKNKYLKQLLVSKKVKIIESFNESEISSKEFINKFNFPPKFFKDYLSLTGNPSDNIFGVHSIGEKTASELIRKYDTIENIYENIEKITDIGLKIKLKNGKNDALLSKKIIQLNFRIDIKQSPDDVKIKPVKKDEMIKFLSELNLTSLSRFYE